MRENHHAPVSRSSDYRVGYADDPEATKRFKVRLPVLLRGSKVEAPNLDEPLIDNVILPRDYEKEHSGHLAELRAKGALDVPMPSGTKSFMSAHRHSLLPQYGLTWPSVRKELALMLERRRITLGVDRRRNQPVRIYVEPAVTAGELSDAFESAGYRVKRGVSSRKVFGECSVLVETSKMGCYSFNLPAGPPSLGGTCPAAELGSAMCDIGDLIKAQKAARDGSRIVDPTRFICSACYALKGNYTQPNNMAQQLVRLYVTEELLKNEPGRSGACRVAFVHEDGSSTTKMSFSEMMILAIEKATEKVRLRRQRLEHFRYTRAEYRQSERTLKWLTARKKILELIDERNKETDSSKIAKVDAEIQSLARWGKVDLSDLLKVRGRAKQLFSDWQLPDPRYFRIHDAGDMYSDRYMRAWLRVCRHFQGKILFWAPTRLWALKGVIRRETLEQIPANLAVRPSTLHFRDAAPTAAYLRGLKLPIYKKGRGGGLSAASGSAPETVSARDFKCPAYEHWTARGGAMMLERKKGKPVAGTCSTACGPQDVGAKRCSGCRACWDHHDLVVFYEEH